MTVGFIEALLILVLAAVVLIPVARALWRRSEVARVLRSLDELNALKSRGLF
jgi:hypothetical protein